MLVTTYKNQAVPDFHTQFIPKNMKVKQHTCMLQQGSIAIA